MRKEFVIDLIDQGLANDSQQSYIKVEQHIQQYQQQKDCSSNQNVYVIQQACTNKFIPANKFPFHHYLKDRYTIMSLQEQIEIFQSYFKLSQSPSQKIKLEPSKIENLYSEINSFFKLPRNPLIFMDIENLNKDQQTVTIKNFFGEIIHFRKAKKDNLRWATILHDYRRLKGKPFVVIKDHQNFEEKRLQRKDLKKLCQRVNFLFLKVVKNMKEIQQLKRQLYISDSSTNQTIRLQVRKQQWFNIQIGFQSSFGCFYAYSNDLGDFKTTKIIPDIKKYLHQHIQSMRIQECQIVKHEFFAHDYGFRIRIFDYMFINFIKTTGKNKKQFIEIMDQISKNYGEKQSMKAKGDGHYLQRMLYNRRCKCCQVLQRGKNKKSQYKCTGCSQKYQVDVAICIRCFQQFHQKVLPYCSQEPNVRKLKKCYLENTAKKGQKRKLYLQKNKNIDCQMNDQEVQKTILKINQNVTEIQKIVEELVNQSFEGAQIAKQFNEYFFARVIQSFNNLLHSNEKSNSLLGEVKLQGSCPSNHIKIHNSMGYPSNI